MATNKIFTITGGPSRGELGDALQYAYDSDKDFRVTFKGQLDDSRVVYTIIARIVGVEHEDGSGHSFNVRAYLRGLPLFHAIGLVEFYYNANQRSGTIKVP